MSIQIKVTGVKEIDQVLRGLPLQLNDRILQQAHTAAVKPLVQKEKLTAPEGPTGNLVDSIGAVKASARSLKDRDLGAINVGPRRGRGYKGYAGHLVEYGTRVRRLKGNGKYKSGNRGVMPKKPFAEPAWQATRSQVIANINGEIGRSLLRFMKRTIKK